MTGYFLPRIPCSELSGVIVIPGPEGAARLETDRVILTRGDGGPVGRTGRFLGVPVGVGTVAELASVIFAPGPQGAVQLEGDRVRPARGDGGPVGRRSDLRAGSPTSTVPKQLTENIGYRS